MNNSMLKQKRYLLYEVVKAGSIVIKFITMCYDQYNQLIVICNTILQRVVHNRVACFPLQCIQAVMHIMQWYQIFHCRKHHLFNSQNYYTVYILISFVCIQATSRLLVSYPEEHRNNILDYLFLVSVDLFVLALQRLQITAL